MVYCTEYTCTYNHMYMCAHTGHATQTTEVILSQSTTDTTCTSTNCIYQVCRYPGIHNFGFPFQNRQNSTVVLACFFLCRAPLLYFLPGTTFATWYWYWSLRAHRVRHHNSSHSYRRAAPPTKAPYLTPVLAFQPSSHFTTRLLARSLFPSLTITIYCWRLWTLCTKTIDRQMVSSRTRHASALLDAGTPRMH